MFTFSTRKDLTSQSLLIAFRDKDDVSISKDVILRKERSHLSKKRNDLDILDQLKEVFSFKLEPQSISIHTNQQAIPSAKEKILHHVY